VGQISITEATDASVVISWHAPGDDGSRGTAAAYDIRYDTVLITSASWNFATSLDDSPVPEVAGTPQSFETDRISSTRTWYFAIKAVDEANNWSVMSNVDSAVAHINLRLEFEEDVDQLSTYTYPNPFQPSETAGVTFANIPDNSNLLVLSISGSVVRRWTGITGGTVIWNGTNQSGNPVASAIYLWFIEGTNIKGKLVVKR